jgi:multidrug efflux pump subunit AcrB
MINVENERIILEPSGNFEQIEGIAELLVPVGNSGQVVALGDITDVEKAYINPPTQLTRINGKEAVSLHVSLKEGANIIVMGEEIDLTIDRWMKKLPIGIDLFRISSLDLYIDEKVGDFVTNLIQAIVIVMAVMLFFLGIRTGLIISSLIPIVTITTFMIMGLIDVGINQITLAALIMALGMMVDNGIVVAESIMVKMEKGKDAKTAAIESCTELFIPLLISTLTTSAAFLSFYLAESTMGDIMGPLFVVISIALLSSWIISFSIITLLCVYFLKIKKKEEVKPKLIDRVIEYLKLQYSKLILWALAWKRLVLSGILGMLVFSFYGFGLLEFLFFPDSDRDMITVDINLPEGTRIEATQATVEAIEAYFKGEMVVNESRNEGIVSWSAFIGEGPSSYDLGYNPDEANSNYAHILVNTSSFEVNNQLIAQLDDFCFNNFPDADIKVSLLSGGGGGTPVEIMVSGPDPDQLSVIAEDIKGQLFEMKGTKNIKDDWGPKGKKFVVKIDPARAQNAGVTNQDIAISLQTFLDGFKAGEYREDDKSIPIMLRSNQIGQQSLTSLSTITVFAQNSGNSVPLSQVASLDPVWQNTKIKRQNLYRTINITSELTEDGNAAEIISDITPWLDEQKQEWGGDYTYSLGGDAEQTAENMGAVAKYLPLSAFIIVLLLIIQFNSFRKMGMIVMTIPLGIIGMVIGLLIFRVPFGFMAFLGVISLAGIVINNALVLIDRMETEERELKRSPQDAIVGACLQRFRPILLATFTTVLGLIPLYMGGGDIWRPMAVTIMVGLLFGTVITLLFIPSMFSLLYKVDFKEYKFNKELMD